MTHFSKHKTIIFLGIILAILLLPKISWAATYYVDFEGGNDTNAGTSTGTAWKTIPGTRNTGNTGWQSTDWGTGTINSRSKVSAGTIFKLKSGTTHDSSNGGYIWIGADYYNDASSASYITFQRDATWGTGAVTFDGTGITAPIALILVQRDGVKWDGVTTDGIVIQDAAFQASGLQVKEHSGDSSSTDDAVYQYLKFYNNGTGCTAVAECTGSAQFQFRSSIDVSVTNITLDGNNLHVMGMAGGDSNWGIWNTAGNATITNITTYNHDGNDPPNDAGIGIKFQNSKITFTNITAYNNLKGMDLGEHHGNNMDITYVVLNSTFYNNKYGIGLSGAQAAYSGNVNFYLINNHIYDNALGGANIYAGPYTAHIVHNVFDNNNTGAADGFNLQITDTDNDTGGVIAYAYNNIFYKPNPGHAYTCNLRVNYISDASSGWDNSITLDMDYNSWVQHTSEVFARWAYLGYAKRATGINYTFNYGADGPGQGSGNWHDDDDDPGVGTGHQGDDANSVGTGATDTTLPPFVDVANHNYTLTASYAGMDISGEPWYIAEMGTDRNGIVRANWDIGAYEYVSGGDTTPPAAPTGVAVQ